jgi:hypothetical protein
MIPPKYSVITLRRTSRFTVYALFDEVAKHVLPETSTRDKAEATAQVKRLNRA